MSVNFDELIWKSFGVHKWVIRVPAKRTCSVCGKQEVLQRSGSSQWWEMVDPGNEAKHYTKEEE